MKKNWFLLAAAWLAIFSGTTTGEPVRPVTPKASPEAVALLDFFYNISGRYILTGQHNFPNINGRNTRFAAEYIGETPVIYSTDWGFAKENDKDSYLARPEIVKEAIKQHQTGSIITICWHAVPPTAKEPVTFQPAPGSSPDAPLASVQGRLTEKQFREILTPGTALYKNWCKQVDSVAFYLKKLCDAHVPVLWRPYHEMNGNWFWWGGRTGKYSTQALYRQLFNRLVKYHKLNNLIWVWSVDRPTRPEMQFSDYYPGNDYIDILALDVYGSDFNQKYYDTLLALSEGKPMVLGEVGNPPSAEILTNQPKWSYWVIWSGMTRNITRKQHQELINDPRVLTLEKKAYMDAITHYRSVCGLTPLPEVKKEPMSFTGKWIFNEERSILDNTGAGNLPELIEVKQSTSDFHVRKTFLNEISDDIVTDMNLVPGKENKTEETNRTGLTTLILSENKDTVDMYTKTTMNMGDRTFTTTSSEKWNLIEKGKVLVIKQESELFGKKRELVLYFNKE